MFLTERDIRYIVESVLENIDKHNDVVLTPRPLNPKQCQVLVSINGYEYSVEEINFKIEPRNFGDITLYQFHLFIDPNLQHKGLGYTICKAFVEEYGNIYCGNGRRLNNEEIPTIFEKLGRESDIEHVVLDIGDVAYKK